MELKKLNKENSSNKLLFFKIVIKKNHKNKMNNLNLQNNINKISRNTTFPKKNFFSTSFTANKSGIKTTPLPIKGANGKYNNNNLTINKKTISKSVKINKMNPLMSKLKFKKNLKIKRVLSLAQILSNIKQQRQKKLDQQKHLKPIKPIIPPKSLIIILKDKPEKAVYNHRIIDYKHCGLLQRYIGLGGKILPRRQTRLTAKQQRFVAKTIKSARIMGLLPFVSKERSYFK